jgi:hypothetical protein
MAILLSPKSVAEVFTVLSEMTPEEGEHWFDYTTGGRNINGPAVSAPTARIAFSRPAGNDGTFRANRGEVISFPTTRAD